LPIQLVYSTQKGQFISRANRFKKEYSRFLVRRYTDLHDRFLVVDNVGYVLGPSIKDAAVKSPALVVKLDAKSSTKLSNFFATLWSRAR